MPDEPTAADSETQTLGQLPLTLDDPRFRTDELIKCPRCERQNPPNRFNCLYCGSTLSSEDVRAEIAKINFQRPDRGEDGFSVIYTATSECSEQLIARAAEILELDSDTLANLVHVGSPVPVAYIRSLPDAQLLAVRLTEAGMDCAIAGDDLLVPQVPPTRLRGIEFTGDGITMIEFNSGQTRSFPANERLLLVSGSIVNTRTESIDKKRKRTNGSAESTETSADESVLDVYPTSDVFGFRVRASGFDFSCLKERMQQIASSNMKLLAERLVEAFPTSILIDGYHQACPHVDGIWPVEFRSEASSVKRGAFGGLRMQRVIATDNTAQFTRFSRLQRHFI